MAVLRLMPSQGSPTPVEISQDKVVVGREPTCDLVVSDGSVSRKHATIERRGDGWAIVDQGSANGTFVDSQRVTELELRTGQELRFGAMAFRVEIESDDAGATILTTAPNPDATVVQEAVPPRLPASGKAGPAAGGPPAPPPPPSVKPPAPPWAAPAKSPVVMPAPPLPTPVPPSTPAGGAAGTPPPLPPRAAGPPPLPPRSTSAPPPPPAAGGPPPLPPRATASRPAVIAPGGPGGPPPAKKGRSPLVWIGGGCCGCLVLVMVFLGVIGGGAYFMTAGAVEVVRAQIADVRKGDMNAAYGRMTEEYKAQHPMEEFVALVDAHPALKENTDSTFLSRNVQNDTATISGTLIGAAGVEEDVVYRLVKQTGGWKINEIEFGEATSVDGAEPPPAAARSSGGLRLETLSAEKSADTTDPAGFVIAIKLRASGFKTEGAATAPRADLVLDLETRGPGGARLPDLSRMELETRNRPDAVDPSHADFDVNVTLHDATPGEYVARLTVRDQIGRDIKTQDVAFTLP